MNNALSTIGRIIYALAIAFFGIAHLTNADKMAGTLPPMFCIIGNATDLFYWCLFAAVSFILNSGLESQVFCSQYFFFSWYSPCTYRIYRTRQQAMVIKDSAMAGAAIMIAGYTKP